MVAEATGVTVLFKSEVRTGGYMKQATHVDECSSDETESNSFEVLLVCQYELFVGRDRTIICNRSDLSVVSRKNERTKKK